jgi:hypothetical protein
MWDARKFDNSELTASAKLHRFRFFGSLSESCTLAVIKIPGTFALSTNAHRLMRRLSADVRTAPVIGSLKVKRGSFLHLPISSSWLTASSIQSSVSLNVIVFLTSCTFFLEFFFQIFSSCSSCVGDCTLLAILKTLCFL